MKKLTSHVKKLSLSRPDLPGVRQIKADLSKVRKIAPNLSDLRKTLVPDTGKLHELSRTLEKAAGRLHNLDDFGNMAKRWGDMSKLIPGWPGDNDKGDSPQADATESEEKEGFKKIQDVLNAPKTHQSLGESMADMKDSVSRTVLAFKRVGAALAEAAITEANEDASDLSRFSDIWSIHQKEFIRLLRMSQETACRARSTANKFVFDLATKLGADTLSTDEKNEKIQEYQAVSFFSIEHHLEIDRSQGFAQGFQGLHGRITDFRGEITDWMTKGDKLKEDILKLTAEIEKAKEGIEKLMRRALLSASSALGLGMLSAGAVALGILCPLLWIGAAFASIKMVNDVKAAWDSLLKRKNQKDKLKNTESEMEGKIASLAEFERIQVILGPALSDLNLICDKLWVISEIWTFIRADLVVIETKMGLAKGSSLLFKTRLKTAALTYSLLSDALGQYEAEIGKLDLE